MLAQFGSNTPCRWTKIAGGSTEYNTHTHPHPRIYPASTVTSQNLLVMFGGCLSGGEYAGPCPSRDGWIYSVEKKYVLCFFLTRANTILASGTGLLMVLVNLSLVVWSMLPKMRFFSGEEVTGLDK